MQPIPRPLVLDAEREKQDDREGMSVDDHRAQSARLRKALRDSCAYGEALWTDLARVRAYLLHSLPGPDGSEQLGASPCGPDDEQGWQRWIDAYSEVTSVLTGPHGDSGLGLSEARRAARDRRWIATGDRPFTTDADGFDDSTPPPPAQAGSSREPPAATPARPLIAVLARPALLGVLVALAARGLRPHRLIPDTDPEALP